MASTPSQSSDLASDLKNHGVAVHNGSTLSMKPWRDPVNGRDYVYLGITCSPSLVVQIDVETGRCRQFNPEGLDGPWGLDFTIDGDILVTSVNGNLFRINPRTGESRCVANLGQWLWNITPAADGRFYLASSPNAIMYRYDPVTDKVEEVARFDQHNKYLRELVGRPDGYVYGTIGVDAGMVMAYHIASGKSKLLLPSSDAVPGFHRLSIGLDNNLYVKTLNGNGYRLEHGEAFPVKDIASKTLDVPTHKWTGFAPRRLPDGRTVTLLDPDAIRIGEGKDARIIHYKYKTRGAGIFHLAEGPDHTVYASTIMPLYMLRYTPATKKLENLGRGGPDNGEAYSITHCDGKVYYATYATGQLMEYDPARPLHTDPPGQMQWKDNPRHVGPLGKGHCRPRAICVDAKKRVWVGSAPEYGMFHGGLMCYDTVSKKLHNNPVVIKNQSVQSLTAHTSENIVFGGTDIARGTGVTPSTKEAHLFAWDTQKQKLLWKQVAIPGQTGILNLLYRDGKLYGTARMTFSFFCFDLATRKMDYVAESRISACREQSMTFGPDGNIYGITYLTLFRWSPKTGEIKVLYSTTPEEAKTFDAGSLFHRGAVIAGNRYYFSCGAKVMSLKLPKFG